jgi:hypothetical protein
MLRVARDQCELRSTLSAQFMRLKKGLSIAKPHEIALRQSNRPSLNSIDTARRIRKIQAIRISIGHDSARKLVRSYWHGFVKMFAVILEGRGGNGEQLAVAIAAL